MSLKTKYGKLKKLSNVLIALSSNISARTYTKNSYSRLGEIGSTCWILLKSWRKEYFFSNFHVCVSVVVSIIPFISTFVFFCKPFLRSDILNCYRAQMMVDNSKAFLLLFGTASLLFQMFLCSNDNIFYAGIFFIYVAIFSSLSFHLKLTKWRRLTIIESFGNQKKMKN